MAGKMHYRYMCVPRLLSLDLILPIFGFKC
jgi:hypothetical protein